MECFIVLLVGIFMILAFLLGVNVTQKIQKNEEVKIPNPISSIKDSIRDDERRKKIEKIEREYQTNLENIDNYVGDGTNQKDFF
nr:MAG TPA: hypothetical protein [Caudoviricetes sp.]